LYSDSVVLKSSAQLHGIGEIPWSLARHCRRDLHDTARNGHPPLVLNPLHPRMEYRSRTSRTAFDNSKQGFFWHRNIRHLPQSMCRIEQI
jgi:hypothetical protein